MLRKLLAPIITSTAILQTTNAQVYESKLDELFYQLQYHQEQIEYHQEKFEYHHELLNYHKFIYDMYERLYTVELHNSLLVENN